MMEKILLCALMLTAVSGCFSPSENIVREFDAGGKVIKESVTRESIVKNVVESTKTKFVVLWDNSFLAFLQATAATVETPTPALKLGVGKADRGMITAPQGSSPAVLAKIVEALRSGEWKVSSSGISAGK